MALALRAAERPSAPQQHDSWIRWMISEKDEGHTEQRVQDLKIGGCCCWLLIHHAEFFFAFVWATERALALGTWIYPHQATAVLLFYQLLICFFGCKHRGEDVSCWRPGWASTHTCVMTFEGVRCAAAAHRDDRRNRNTSKNSIQSYIHVCWGYVQCFI